VPRRAPFYPRRVRIALHQRSKTYFKLLPSGLFVRAACQGRQCRPRRTEVASVGGTTAGDFLIGLSAARFCILQAAITYSCCSGCGPVGNALALSTCPQPFATLRASIRLSRQHRHRRLVDVRLMRARLVVQHDDGTPTRPRSVRLITNGILGRDGWFAFMRW
jgi:hypothetical protein